MSIVVSCEGCAASMSRACAGRGVRRACALLVHNTALSPGKLKSCICLTFSLGQATSNVDTETDRAIQQALRTAFTDCTVGVRRGGHDWRGTLLTPTPRSCAGHHRRPPTPNHYRLRQGCTRFLLVHWRLISRPRSQSVTRTSSLARLTPLLPRRC